MPNLNFSELIKNHKNCAHRMTRIRRCPPIRPFGCTQGKLFSLKAESAQAQASIILSIPY